MNWSQPALEAVAKRVGERTGLAFEAGRRGGAEAAIRRAMTKLGLTDPIAYGRRVETDPAVLDDLIAEMTVGETYFFREPDQFEFLRKTALPELRSLRGAGVGLRAWSAACSSGEEAYSLAIVLGEADPTGRGRVLATDISQRALAKARMGQYGAWSLRGDASQAARPYLRPIGDRFEVVESLRRSVSFAPLNLASSDYPSGPHGTQGLDLIFCRNVLIYLDRDTIRGVVRRLSECLAPGGWLVVASSDPNLKGLAPLDVVTAEGGLFYRRADGSPSPARPSSSTPYPDRAAEVPSPALFPSHLGGGNGDWLRTAAQGPVPLDPALTPRSMDKKTDLVPPPSALAPIAPDSRGVAIQEAREAFRLGRYRKVIERLRLHQGDFEADLIRLRSLANLDPAEAARASIDMVRQHPCQVEFQQLSAVLLLALGRDEEAAAASRRVLYLDRGLAIAHFTLGTILRRQGDLASARKAFRNAREICRNRPSDEAVPLGDGERAGTLAERSEAILAQLGPASGDSP